MGAEDALFFRIAMSNFRGEINEGEMVGEEETLKIREAVIEAVMAAERELTRAMSIHPSLNSAHEGYAVIKEELDELWDEIKKRSSIRDNDRMREEAVQVAAMGLRFVVDVCTKGTR